MIVDLGLAIRKRVTVRAVAQSFASAVV